MSFFCSSHPCPFRVIFPVSFAAVCCVCFSVPSLVCFVPARLACVPVHDPAAAPVGVGMGGLVGTKRGPGLKDGARLLFSIP
jgi:hypothetical protein